MQKINSKTTLRDTIIQLEKKQLEEGLLLKTQFYLAYDSMQPINIIRSTFKKIVENQDIKQDMLRVSIGGAITYLSNKIFKNKTKNSFQKILAAAMFLGITTIIAKNPETLKSLGVSFLHLIKSKFIKKINTSDSAFLE